METGRGVGGAVCIIEESLITKSAVAEGSRGIGESLKTHSRTETEWLETHWSGNKTVERLITTAVLAEGVEMKISAMQQAPRAPGYMSSS